MILKNLDAIIVDTNNNPIIIERVFRDETKDESGNTKFIERIEDVKGTLGLCIKESLLRDTKLSEALTEEQIVNRYNLYNQLKKWDNNLEIEDWLLKELKLACMQRWPLYQAAQIIILINANK